LSLNVARFAIDEGEFDAAAHELESQEARESGWRAAWWRGILHMAEGRPSDGLAYFAAVAAELPGELAPKLAMATCFEQTAGELDDRTTTAGDRTAAQRQQLEYAVRYYSLVAATDVGYASASFGLARVFMALGDREGAVTALQRIPKSSSAHATAQVALCKVRCAQMLDEMPSLSDLSATSETLQGLALENSVRLPLVRGLHEQALTMLLDGSVAPDEAVILGGAELSEFGQRTALERTYRSLAKLAPSDEERCVLIDQANAYRPRTLT